MYEGRITREWLRNYQLENNGKMNQRKTSENMIGNIADDLKDLKAVRAQEDYVVRERN